jgi:ribosomal protein S18 acetylase RimI-like enzyme
VTGSGVTGGGDAPTALVGTVTLAPAGSSYAEVAEPGEFEVRMLAVAPEARRRGVAEALTRAAMLEAVTVGARRVVLSTLDTMTSAQRLYARLGFVARPDRDWHHEDVVLRVYAWDVPPGPGIRIETALWRPREVHDVSGWRVGVSGGFTRRANSVVAIAEPDDVPASIDEVERVYAGAGLPPIFRVCSQSRPEDLDDLLQRRGYRTVSRTIVMVCADLAEGGRSDADGWAGGAGRSDRDGRANENGLRCVAADAPDEAWLSAWLDVRSSHSSTSSSSTNSTAFVSAHATDHALATEVVTGAPGVYLSARQGEATVGVIRAAFEQDWVGLSCLTVAPGARRRGIGRTLTLEGLRLARERGARHAFLQVEESNAAAIALYEQLGFTPAERYHYRQR